MRQNETTLSAGTFCSGTDYVITVCKTFLAAASHSLGINEKDAPVLDHIFSCEKDSNKQNFIREFYNDVKTVHTDALEATPESVRFCSAGFPCDDASGLHPRSSSGKHRMCVAEVGFETQPTTSE